MLGMLSVPRARWSMWALAGAAIVGFAGAASARDLVVALKTEPTSMDPQYHVLTPNVQLSQTLFDPLVCSDADLVSKPCLAQSWTASGQTRVASSSP